MASNKKRRTKLAVGTVFAIPIGSGRYCYGKLLIDNGLRKAACIYDVVSSDHDQISSAQRVIRLRYIFISGLALYDNVWPSLTVETIGADETLDEDAYLIGSPPHGELLRFSGGTRRVATAEDYERYLSLLIRGDNFIEAALRNMFDKNFSEKEMIAKLNRRALDEDLRD